MTTMRAIQDVTDSSDSSDSSSFVNNEISNNNNSNLNLYKTDPLKCGGGFANKLDAYNNNQLLLPAQFYKTLLAKAVFSSNTENKNNIYKNMLFHKDRDFDQVRGRREPNLFLIFNFFLFAFRKRSAGTAPRRAEVPWDHKPEV